MELKELLKQAGTEAKKNIELFPGDTITVQEDYLYITDPLTIEGNGAVIEGTGNNRIKIASSDVTLRGIHFRGFGDCLEIDGMGGEIHQIHIENCIFSDYRHNGILTGSSVSGSTIRTLEIGNCEFHGPGASVSQGDVEGCFGIMLQVTSTESTDPVEDCAVEDVFIHHCMIDNCNRMAIYMTGNCTAHLSLENLYGYGETGRLRMKNVEIADCEIRDCWDASINLLTGMIKQRETLFENITIRRNKVEQGIWGVYITAAEPFIGHGDTIHVRNVLVEDNEFYERKGGPGEASYGVAVMAGRADYFPGITCDHCLTEQIVIRNNTIRDVTTGVIVAAADSLIDGAGVSVSDCTVRDVVIEYNQIMNVENVFILTAAWMEGRLFDYQIGVPAKNKVWGEHITNHETVTVNCENNVATDITIRNNVIDGYRYKYVIGAALARGHARIKNNRLENLTLENNLFQNGEAHIRIQSVIVDDWVKDEGNVFDPTMKWHI